MAIKTGIQWCDATWNPWYGCHKVSSGCKNCYMYREEKRFGKNPNIVHRANRSTFDAPNWWYHRLPAGSKIFVCSWSDFFIEEADPWRKEAWDIIGKLKNFKFIICTKRPSRIIDCLPVNQNLRNVWFLVSVEDYTQMHRWNTLNSIATYVRTVEVPVRGISFEPLLGPIQIGDASPDWIITGGESGSGYRPMDMDWVRKIRDECKYRNIPYFHKQNGGTKKIAGAWGGSCIDGIQYKQFPEPGIEIWKDLTKSLTD